MRKSLLSLCISAAIASPVAVAGDNHLEAEIQLLRERLNQLEALLDKQQQTIEAQQKAVAEVKAQPVLASSNGPEIEIGGVVEFEAIHAKTDGQDSTSDMTVATVELAVAAQVNDWVAAEVVFLFEEDATDFNVDTATITIANADVTPFSFTFGMQFVPFGHFDTMMVSDPLTLEIGETNNTAATVGYESGGLYAAASWFNGDGDDNGADHADRVAAKLGYAFESGDMSGDLGVSYMNNIGDSGGLQPNLGAVLNDYVGGVAAHASLANGPFAVIAEYVKATDEFANGGLVGRQPKALNVEVGYAFDMGKMPANIALGYQKTDDLQPLALPEKRIAVALSVEMFESTALNLEFAHDQDYGIADGGTGNDTNTLTVQLATEF